jgi:phenylalanyl-tRNA synthetase alpha subunit
MKLILIDYFLLLSELLGGVVNSSMKPRNKLLFQRSIRRSSVFQKIDKGGINQKDYINERVENVIGQNIRVVLDKIDASTSATNQKIDASNAETSKKFDATNQKIDASNAATNQKIDTTNEKLDKISSEFFGWKIAFGIITSATIYLVSSNLPVFIKDILKLPFKL